MPVFRIPSTIWFPDPEQAHPSGVVAVGGDLSAERLRAAYRQGIFPWYNGEEPVLWWSPDPRMVLDPHALHLGRSLRKRIRRGDYRITMDTAFDEVLIACARVPRPGQDGTWLSADLRRGMGDLHTQGIAHSIEAWDGDGTLVGGLYGVACGRTFCGESMFATASDASKVAFAWTVVQLRRWGVTTIDCQVHTDHLDRFGAREIARTAFLSDLQAGLDRGPPQARWSFDPALTPAVVAEG